MPAKAHPALAFLATLLAAALVLSACSSEEDSTQDPAQAKKTIEETVRKSLEAENAKDTKKFLALWTDKGLKQYDVGSREDLESGKSKNFGEEEVRILEFGETAVTGDKGSTSVTVLTGEHQIAKPVFLAKFALIQKDDEWLLNGFEFLGSPPPAAGAPRATIDAVDYAFALDKSEVPPDVAFKFSNKGKEAHEIALFKGPTGTEVSAAKTLLENVNGQELDNVPPGYQVDHIAFSPPGESVDLTFAEPLGSGEYFLVCYLPKGGFDKTGKPVDPEGEPHIKLGMITKLTIK